MRVGCTVFGTIVGCFAVGFGALSTGSAVAQQPFQQSSTPIQPPAATVIAPAPAYGNPVIQASTTLAGSELNWQCKTIETLGHAPGYRKPVVTGVSIDSQSSLIALVGDDHFVSIFDLEKDEFVGEVGEHRDWVRAAKFSPNGSWLATAGNDRKLMLWTNESWEDEQKQPVFTMDHPEAIIDFAFSSDSSRIATVGFQRGLKIYNVTTGQLERELDCACDDNHAVAFSADGTILAAAGRNGVIRAWQTSTWNLITEYKAHDQRIRSLAFDGNGNIISCSDDQTVCVSSPANPREMRKLPRHPCKLYDISMVGPGTIATAGSDNRIRIWQLETGEEIGVLNGHTGTVSSLAVSGTTLVSGSFDTQVRVWSMERQASAPATNGWNPKR